MCLEKKYFLKLLTLLCQFKNKVYLRIGKFIKMCKANAVYKK